MYFPSGTRLCMVSRPLDRLGKVVAQELSCSRTAQQASKEPLNNVTSCWLGGVQSCPLSCYWNLNCPSRQYATCWTVGVESSPVRGTRWPEGGSPAKEGWARPLGSEVVGGGQRRTCCELPGPVLSWRPSLLGGSLASALQLSARCRKGLLHSFSHVPATEASTALLVGFLLVDRGLTTR